MKAKIRILLSCAVLAGLSACGQKGPLYLPDKPGDVVTRSPAEQTEAAPETAPSPGTATPADEKSKNKN